MITSMPFFSPRVDQSLFFIWKWLKTFMMSYHNHFKERGDFYLKTKGMSLDVWMEAIEDGCRGDVLTLYTLSILTNIHTYIHLHEGQFWSTLKNIPGTHEEIVKNCELHLLYLGCGMFVKLKKCEIPLSLAPNPDPSVSHV